MDDSIDSPSQEGGNGDIPVDIKTLELEGQIRPAVGDKVEIQVGGVVRQIVDQTAFVTPDTANGQPLAKAQNPSDSDSLQAAAMQSDMGTGGY
jgi:hypothetical protein